MNSTPLTDAQGRLLWELGLDLRGSTQNEASTYAYDMRSLRGLQGRGLVAFTRGETRVHLTNEGREFVLASWLAEDGGVA